MAKLDSIFHCLADPTRRAVIAQLATGASPVSELAAPHDMALPSFMKHINVLEAGGWIETQKKGRVRTCRLCSGAIETAESWLDQQRRIWERRLDQLDDFVATLDDERIQK